MVKIKALYQQEITKENKKSSRKTLDSSAI
jgi:hypothetical protein